MKRPAPQTASISLESAAPAEDAPRYPGLRGASLLYLLVILATAAVIVGLSQVIDVVFLRFISAIFIQLGFVVAAMLIAAVRPAQVLGRRPTIIALLTGFVAGLVVWPPATWMLAFSSQFLGGLFGNLPRTLSSQATIQTQTIMFGVVLPLCQGLLFFGYIFTAARGLGRWRSVLLVAALFGMFGLYSSGLGISAILPYALVGLVAGALTLHGGSMWTGALVLSGFNLGEPILRDVLLNSLLKGQAGDPLSFGWLTLAALSLLLTFLLIQVARALLPGSTSDAALTVYARVRPFWWGPIVLVTVLCLVLGFGEIVSRSRNNPTTPRRVPTPSGSTSPPLAGTRPAAPITPLQTPQPTNQ